MRPLLQSWIRNQHGRYLLRRGIHLMQQGSGSAAVSTFTAALPRHIDSEAVYLKRGLAYWQQHQVEAAEADFNQAIALNSQCTEAYGHRGLIRYERGDEAGALEDWAIALQHQPQNATIRYNRGLTYFQRQLFLEALADFDVALQQNPLLAEAYLHRGKVKQHLGDLSGAVADWELALCNDLRLEEAHQLLTQIRRQAERHGQQNQFKDLLPEGCSLDIEQQGVLLTFVLHRPVGTPFNYFTFPSVLQERLAALQIPEARRFRLVAKSGGSSFSEWDQTYSIYDKIPCPPARWRASLLTTLLLFPPFGVLALVYSAKVKPAYRRGDYPIAVHASQAVRKLFLSSGAIMGAMMFLLASYGVYTYYESMPYNPAAKTALSSDAEALEENL